MIPHRQGTVVAGLLLVVLAAVAPGLQAQSKGEFFGGLSATYFSLRGSSFNGSSGVDFGGMYGAVPKMTYGPGVAAVIGIRGESYGIEVSYHFSANTGTAYDPTIAGGVGSSAMRSNSHNVMLDFKYHFWPDRTVGIYAVGGLAIAFLSVPNGAFGEEATGETDADGNAVYAWTKIGDLNYVAIGIDLGVGLEITLSERLTLSAGVIVRPVFFSTVNLTTFDQSYASVPLEYQIKGMNATGLGLCLGLIYNFTTL